MNFVRFKWSGIKRKLIGKMSKNTLTYWKNVAIGRIDGLTPTKFRYNLPFFYKPHNFSFDFNAIYCTSWCYLQINSPEIIDFATCTRNEANFAFCFCWCWYREYWFCCCSWKAVVFFCHMNSGNSKKEWKRNNFQFYSFCRR